MTISEFLDPNAWFQPKSGPRYSQLRQRLQDAISQGVLAPNSALPPEREIADMTGFSRVTVRDALQALAENGSIIQRQGSGTFVIHRSPKIEQSLIELTSFSEDMARRGWQSSSIWLERGIVRATKREIEVLELEENTSIARIRRLRLADEQPLAIECAQLPIDILPNPLEVEDSLYDILRQNNNCPVRATQRLTAQNLQDTDAELLALPAGAAALSIERTSFLASGRVAEFTRSLYRGDAYDFVAELQLKSV